jgi:predicted GIY-YIG superfamily endonuclease
MNAGPHILYRCFNADRELLYIGITNDIDNRLRQHSRTAPWWKEFDSCSQDDRFEDRWTLERAERAAILAEEPLYNISHCMGQRAMQLESERSKIRASIVQGLFTAHAGPQADEKVGGSAS